MSTANDTCAEALLQPDAPLWQRSLVTAAVCGVAAVVFVWAAGDHPGARLMDERMAVAECWDAIERAQPAGESLHEMRVACQQMESVATAHETGIRRLPPTGQAIAMGE